MTLHTVRLIELMREAAQLIHERGLQAGTTQWRGDANAGLTIVGAFKLALGHRPNATVDQLGEDALMFSAAVHYINIFMGSKTFKAWCEFEGHTKSDARLLLNTMAGELERRTQNVSH